MPAPLHDLGALEAAGLMAGGQLTSVTLVEHLLTRIARLEPTLHALIAVNQQALEQARAADARRSAGAPLSPLDGIPVVIKDNIEAVGLPATVGSLALAGSPAERDAGLVTRLRDAGMVILAASNLSEWANFRGQHSTSGWSGVGGLTDNPWRAGRSAGGSSSGSGAALAARYAPVAVGTETDGSITCPAALCGVVGIKPTVGTVPMDGVAPISASQDSAGPMGRSVADVEALLAVLTGSQVPGVSAAAYGPVGTGSDVVPPVRRYVLGAPAVWLTGDPETDGLFARTLGLIREAGIAVVAIGLPDEDDQVGADEVTVLVHEMSDDLDAYLASRPGAAVASAADKTRTIFSTSYTENWPTKKPLWPPRGAFWIPTDTNWRCLPMACRASFDSKFRKDALPSPFKHRTAKSTRTFPKLFNQKGLIE